MGMELEKKKEARRQILLVFFLRVVKTCRDRLTKQEYAVKVC